MFADYRITSKFSEALRPKVGKFKKLYFGIGVLRFGTTWQVSNSFLQKSLHPTEKHGVLFLANISTTQNYFQYQFRSLITDFGGFVIDRKNPRNLLTLPL